MEQTMNEPRPQDAPPERTSWRSVGGLASAWADRVTLARQARAAGDDGALAAGMGIAAE